MGKSGEENSTSGSTSQYFQSGFSLHFWQHTLRPFELPLTWSVDCFLLSTHLQWYEWVQSTVQIFLIPCLTSKVQGSSDIPLMVPSREAVCRESLSLSRVKEKGDWPESSSEEKTLRPWSRQHHDAYNSFGNISNSDPWQNTCQSGGGRGREEEGCSQVWWYSLASRELRQEDPECKGSLDCVKKPL